jgi:hypothetical protein
MARLLSDTLADTALPEVALAELERLNEAAAPLHIWLRTRANRPLQRPWHEAAEEPVPDPAPPGAASPRSGPLRVLPHVWKWTEEDVSEVLVCYALVVYATQSNPQANRVIA